MDCFTLGKCAEREWERRGRVCMRRERWRVRERGFENIPDHVSLMYVITHSITDYNSKHYSTCADCHAIFHRACLENQSKTSKNK